jgi:hypothetical protein
MDTLSRNHRFSYEPIIDDDGITKTVEQPTLQDEARFRAMAPYDCMTADYIAVLSGATGDFGGKTVTHRFNVLKREPNRWVDIHEAQMKNKTKFTNDFLAYTLNPKTENLLEAKGFSIHSYGCSGPLNHKLMASWIRASYDIATKIEKVPATSIPFHEIAANVDIKTRQGEPRTCIPIMHGNEEKRVFSDCYPHALYLHDSDSYILILDETDCDSMALTQIEAKYEDYIQIIEKNLCDERYGFQKTVVTFETTYQPHLDRMKRKLEQITKNPKVLRRILFKRHVSLKTITKEDRPRPTGHMVTEPWQRAGGLPDYNMLKGE